VSRRIAIFRTSMVENPRRLFPFCPFRSYQPEVYHLTPGIFDNRWELAIEVRDRTSWSAGKGGASQLGRLPAELHDTDANKAKELARTRAIIDCTSLCISGLAGPRTITFEIFARIREFLSARR
jgi:hypothetical protein